VSSDLNLAGLEALLDEPVLTGNCKNFIQDRPKNLPGCLTVPIGCVLALALKWDCLQVPPRGATKVIAGSPEIQHKGTKRGTKRTKENNLC
jgi:hypothetical protein